MTLSEFNHNYGAVLQAGVVLISLVTIWYQISVQRNEARKRASFDFIAGININAAFLEHSEKLGNITANADDLTNWSKADLRSWLMVYNLYEIVAANIREKTLDEKIIHRIMRSQVTEEWLRYKTGILEYRKKQKAPKIYAEWQYLAERWEKHGAPSDKPLGWFGQNRRDLRVWTDDRRPTIMAVVITFLATMLGVSIFSVISAVSA